LTIYDEKAAGKVYKQMMDTQVTMTQRELLSLSPELRTQVNDMTARWRFAHINMQESIEDTELNKPERSTEKHMPTMFSVTKCAVQARKRTSE